MMVIIEGLDKTGKTTLINYLLKKIPKTFLIKNGDRPLDSSHEERKKIKNIMWKIYNIHNNFLDDSVLLLDRFLYSEFVYGYKRGYDAYKDSEIIDIKNSIENRKNLLIHCDLDSETIAENFKREKEDYISTEEIDDLRKKYKSVIDDVYMRKMEYNYKEDSPLVVRSLILEKMGW